MTLKVWNRVPARSPRAALFDASLALMLLGIATVVVWDYFKTNQPGSPRVHRCRCGPRRPEFYALIRGFIRPFVEGKRR